LLAKADLLTDMVGEFPELQGIMGTYYAIHDGEHADVAAAASEHYQPRFAGDTLPATATGTAVALADKLETLVGIWGIGLQPTGDKDPFALRRHALGILRMLVEKRLTVSLQALIAAAVNLFAGNANFKDPSADVLNFLFDRLRGQLRERGFSQNEVEAVVAQNPDTLNNIVERLQAVQSFAALPESASLAAANKRITNILKKAEGTPGAVAPALLQEAAEQALYKAMGDVKPGVDAAYAAGDFTGALKTLAALREGVDSFFNDVMVNAEDLALRNNRLALLAELHTMLNQVADISKLAA
jgi:glycyl-tRNA synthetase beta chain